MDGEFEEFGRGGGRSRGGQLDLEEAVKEEFPDADGLGVFLIAEDRVRRGIIGPTNRQIAAVRGRGVSDGDDSE